MSDGDDDDNDDISGKQIKLAEMCLTHRQLLISQLEFFPTDPWQILEIVTQVTLFQSISVDDICYSQLNGNIENVRTLGCMACKKPDIFGKIIEEASKCRKKVDKITTIKNLGLKIVEDATAATAAITTKQSNLGLSPVNIPLDSSKLH